MDLEEAPGDDLRRVRLIVIPILSAVALLGTLDLISDAPTTWMSVHVLLELSLIAVSAGGALVLATGWGRAADSLAESRRALIAERAEAAEWRAKAESALHGFRTAIQEQFVRWGLSPAEHEVAMLVLQGLGHKQIAFATGRSERTVRQHAVAVYQKSGLSGRAELAAFFLEGLRAGPEVGAGP